jgi:flagellin
VAVQNRLEYTVGNLDTAAENRIRIRDVDMVKEMTTFMKNNIFGQTVCGY